MEMLKVCECRECGCSLLEDPEAGESGFCSVACASEYEDRETYYEQIGEID